MSDSAGIETIPLFPLANVVLFPGGRVPLHVFEPRYRAMTVEALAGDRRIGMVTVLPEHADEMGGDPPVFPVGCAGRLEQAQQRRDGRYDVVLVGTHRFRIVEEPPRPPDRLYRCARVLRLEERLDEADIPHLHALRMKVIEGLGRLVRHLAPDDVPELDAARFAGIDDPTFVNVLCQLLDLPPAEKQGLLDAPGLLERCQRLAAMIRFRLAELEGGLPGAARTLH